MSEQKVPLLSAEMAARSQATMIWPIAEGKAYKACITAIAVGAAVVIPRAELEAKDARIAELESKVRELSKEWVVPSAIKPGHEPFYQCGNCQQWSSQKGSNHPRCKCGSDNFLWGNPMNYDPENPPQGEWVYPTDAIAGETK